MEINDIIKSKLENIGEEINCLKPFMKEYLTKIETIIQSKRTIQEDALRIIKENRLSVSSISKELGCSRTTLYNHNQLLKRYIEFSEGLFNQNDPFIAYDDLKASVRRLKMQVGLIEDIDASIEILKQEKKELSTLLKEKEKEIKWLQSRISEVCSENNHLKAAQEKQQTSYLVNIKDIFTF